MLLLHSDELDAQTSDNNIDKLSIRLGTSSTDKIFVLSSGPFNVIHNGIVILS